MKKIRMFLLVILVICLASSVVVCISKVQKVNNTQQTIKELEEEIKKLKTSVEKKEETNQKLEEEKAEVESELKELKKEQPLQNEAEEKTNVEEKEDKQVNGKKVAIDPGHQGFHVNMSAQEPLGPGSGQMKAKASSGTTGRFTGVPEFELNLTVSKLLQEELEKRGYEVLLTRQDNDTAISNKERALLAADFGADIYVRIHANGSDNSSTNGAMTMVPSANNPFVPELHEKSYALGEAVINAYCQSCGIQNNGVQLFDNMTGINWSKVPVIILEMGFMTNESDDVNMQNPDFQALMVLGIANGIDEYFAAGN